MATKAITVHRYLGIWLGLIGLTFLSFLCSLLNLGAVDVYIALGIAVAKSTLVGLFFMHLIEERASSALVVLVSACLVALLVSLMVAEVGMRHTFPKAPIPSVDESP